METNRQTNKYIHCMRANAQMKQTDTDAQSNRVEPKL